MAKNNVVAFQPYAVTVDVSVELHLITMEVTLCFGPFNSKEEAQEWCLALEEEHKVIEGREALEDANMLEQSGFPTKPFLRAYVHGADILQVEAGGRAKGALIKPGTAVVDAHQIHVYALGAFEEAIAAARCFLDGAEEE